MKLSHLMMFAVMIGCGAVFAKTEITPPTLVASPYTGSVQEATVPESADWTVVFKESGEHVGTYDIFLRLTDPENFAWTGSNEPMIAVPFEITQAANEWTVMPSITGWTFGETAHEPTAAAKFGAVRPVVYNGTTASGETVANAAAVSEAGSYTATFDVAASADYKALRQVVSFTVAKPVEKATLTAEAGWKLLKATGTYFAQVKVKCTDGYAAGISNLRFAFADRKDGAGKALAQLWNTTGRSAVSATAAYQGTTYRVVPLSAASITGMNVPATYGVSSLSSSSIPVGERIIEMYVPKRDLPSHLGEYTACILWDSQGKTYLAPVANTSAQ